MRTPPLVPMVHRATWRRLPRGLALAVTGCMAAACVAACVAAPAGAQPGRTGAVPGGAAPATVVRGTVRDSATLAPIPGAVVVALGATGDTLGRTVTTEAGAFRLLPRADATRLQLVRIGFRPRAVRLDASTPARGGAPAGAGERVLNITMARLPTLLERVEVTALARCPRRPDRADAWALLEQARAGLLAMLVAREANPAAVRRLVYSRTFADDGRRVVQQRVRVDSSADATSSFDASRSAADFVRLGFRTVRDGEQTLYGPDAQVLLDAAFARNYCFHLAEPDPSRPDQAGVAFAPARRLRGRVDIAGTLRIDTVARTVTAIDFRYVGIDAAAARAGAGGEVHFGATAGGVAFIDRWWLRSIGPAPLSDDDADRVAPAAVPATVLTEVGGELVRARWGDGDRYDAELGTLVLTARDSTGTPVAGVPVRLDHTAYGGVTDTAGTVTLRDLLPGPYRVVVADPRLASIRTHVPTGVAPVVARGDTVRRDFRLPSAEALVARWCGLPALPATFVALVARIIDEAGDPQADMPWRLRASRDGRWVTVADRGRTYPSGRLQLCRGLAVGDLVELQWWRGRQPPQSVMQRIDGPLTVVPVLDRPGPRRVYAATGRTRLVGVVRAADADAQVADARIADARIAEARIAEARIAVAGTLLETLADSSGAFLLGGIPQGRHTLDVRTPWLDSLGAVHRVEVTLADSVERVAITLPSSRDLMAALCGTDTVGAVIVARVHPVRREGLGRDVRGSEPPTTAPAAATGTLRVSAEWPERVTALFGTGRTAPRMRWVDATPDGSGTVRLCGVPVAAEVVVRAAHAVGLPGAALPGTALPGAAPIAVRVAADRRAARIDLWLDATVPQGAHFTGTVTDSAGAPVANAEVLLPELERATLSGADGRFRLVDIPAGAHAVSVRREGYVPQGAVVEFRPNAVVEHRIALPRRR